MKTGREIARHFDQGSLSVGRLHFYLFLIFSKGKDSRGGTHKKHFVTDVKTPVPVTRNLRHLCSEQVEKVQVKRVRSNRQGNIRNGPDPRPGH